MIHRPIGKMETTETIATMTATNGPAGDIYPSWPSLSWDSILTRLSHHADVTPHKTAISFLQTSGNGTPTVSSSIEYQTLNHAVEYLASRLLPPDDAADGATTTRRMPPLVPVHKSGRRPLVRGDRVLLVYPPCSPHFILTFLACIRAGLVAVPVYPPHPDRVESVAAFVAIARGCNARVALTNGEYANVKRLGGMKSAFSARIKTRGRESRGAGGRCDILPTWPEELIWIVTDRELVQDPPHIGSYPRIEAQPEPHEIAFIQYTSGSTSSPKGVVLTHNNLAHNLHIITDELKAGVETRVVSWLPQYHDMGLIGSLIGVIYCGGSGWYMSPIAFLQRPMGWLEAVSEYRGTHLQAPNFAFGLTARKFNPDEYFYSGLGGSARATNNDGKKVKALDLSCLKHVINGAEPVTEKSMEAFCRVFSPLGLPDGVIYPTYGLAEHTVFVCSGGKGKIAVMKKDLEEENKAVVVEETAIAKSQDILHFLGCGFPSSQNVDVRIVDPVRGASLPDCSVGEIWINSPSKAVGYYGKSVKETKADFHALLESDEEMSNGYLRSGDLGFLYKEQLYICGRIKDLIIVGGRNHYPQDIEATAEDVASKLVRPGCSAAFSTADTGECLEVVIVMELKEPIPKVNECESIVNSIQTAILREHSLSLSFIVLVKQKTIPKTTSGKIQRAKARQAFLGKTLHEVYRKEFLKNGGEVSGSCRNENVDVRDDCDVVNTGDFEMIGVKEGDQTLTDTRALMVDATDHPGTSSAPRKLLTPAEIRSLSKPEIRNMILDSISQVANIDKTAVKDVTPLNSIMDSVTLAQLKGLLEGQYAVSPMSDAYLFQDSTTVKKLVEIVKAGAANDDTGQGHIGGTSSGGGSPGCCGCMIM
jgi:acyl-CoA synthetase (AMP-forming)/AMP-acid ligase II